MNKRIQELAEQCRTEVLYEEYGGYIEQFDEEKFAELIIKECADIATMNQHQWEPVGLYVLKHFGIGGVVVAMILLVSLNTIMSCW